MSHDQSHESDRSAAFRGLVLGVIVLGIILYTIVRLTNARYAAESGSKTASRVPAGSCVALDS
jgi:hypothetical protein